MHTGQRPLLAKVAFKPPADSIFMSPILFSDILALLASLYAFIITGGPPLYPAFKYISEPTGDIFLDSSLGDAFCGRGEVYFGTGF